MSTSTAAANAELATVLRDNEDYVLSVTKSKAVDLSEKMFQSSLISDSMMDQFSSLDHSKVEPQLQLRYLLRLVNQRIQQDDSVGDSFLSLLKTWGEQSLCEYLKRSISGEKQPMTKIQLDNHLCSDDISWLLEVLVDVSHNWEAVAIALGLHTYQRHNIKGASNIDKLTKVLDVWLSGGTTTPLTVNTLTNALRSKLVGQGRLALELEEKYKSTTTAKNTSNIKRHDNSSLPFKIAHQSPRKVEVEDGKSTILIAYASVRKNVFYQWNKNGQPLADNISSHVADQTCYSGVHEDMLFINHAHQGTQGEYTCCVSNEERQVVSNKVTLTVLYTPEKKALLDKYSSVNSQVPPNEAWPPVGAETFIKLALVKCKIATNSTSYFVDKHLDKVLENNKEFEYKDVFSEYRSTSFFLVEGRPGSGKTTLACKLVKDWSQGIVLTQAKLVYHVTLRTLINDCSKNFTLSEILQPFYSSCDTLKAVVSNIEKSNGEGVCFVFDGLDEYNPHRVGESVVFRILHRRYLSQTTIIVFSRPRAMDRLRREVVTQHIEVLGFTVYQISEYIDNFPFDGSSDSTFGPSELKEYLQLHPNVLHMCYLPIHAAIICFVYNIKKGDLPHTQTKIYEEFTKCLIIRHFHRYNSEIQINSLKELPDRVCEYFKKLCFLAFDMTFKLKQVINSNEIPFPLSRDTGFHGDWSLGLVTCNRTAQLSGVSTSYMFLHLTLQEFLAAYYIANAEEEKKLQLFQRITRVMHLSFNRLWTFCFGLETFQSHREFDIYREILKDNYLFIERMIGYAFESQDQIWCDEVMRISGGRVSISYVKPSDVTAVKFVISNTTQPIVEIELPNSESDPIIVIELLEEIRNAEFPKLVKLNLRTVSPNSRTLQNLSMILGCCVHLRHLELNAVNLTDDGGVILADSTKYLNQLENVKSVIIHQESIGQSPEFLNVINQIHCFTQLKILILSNWKMDLQCCEVLASNLCHLLSMEHLDLEQNDINSEGAVSLALALYNLNKLKELRLNHNKINSKGAISLASALRHLTKLNYVYMDNNTVGSKGAICLAYALHRNTKLKDLSLSENGIDAHSAIQIITLLKNCQKLECVCLNSHTHYAKTVFIQEGFHLQGLITSDESATIDRLVSAARLHKQDIDLHLGFKTINVQHKK